MGKCFGDRQHTTLFYTKQVKSNLFTPHCKALSQKLIPSYPPLSRILYCLSPIESKPYLYFTPLNKILSFLSASELKAYLSYLLLSQIVSLLAPIESNFMFLYPPVIQILNFLKHFLRCNSRLYSFGEMPKRICIRFV